MPLDDQVKLSYSSVADLSKQLITLGTGVVTLEVTFAKAFVEKTLASSWQLQSSWALMLLSIVAGVWVLMALTGSMAKNSPPQADDVYKSNIRLPALAQIGFFAGGMVFTILFGLKAAG